MTRIEELWHAFEQRTLPPHIPDTPRRVVMHAYHRGAFDMLTAINQLKASRPSELVAALRELELYLHTVLVQKTSPREPLQ